MALLLRGVATAFDAIFAPLGWVSPIVGLATAALVTAVLVLLVVKRTSNQARVRRAKDGMYAALLEMRLFNDDIAAVFRAQWDVLRWNGRYLAAAFVPVLWLIVPFSLVIAELDAFYAFDGLALHAPALVTAHVRTDRPVPGAVSLSAPVGLAVETPAVWFPATREVVWRVRPDHAGRYTISIAAASHTIETTAVVSDAVTRRSPTRGPESWLNVLEADSEPPLPPDSTFDAVSVSYPPRDVAVFGWRPPWFVIYGTLVIVFGFALSRVLGVEI